MAGHVLAHGLALPVAGPAGRHLPEAVVVKRPGRLIAQQCGAALVGAGVGVAVVAVWTQALAAQRRSCQQAGGLCLGPDLMGIASGVMVVVILSAGGLAVLRVRPLLASVPAALASAWLTVTAVDRAIPGGQPPPAWLAASLLAAGYGAVCMAVTSSGRTRQAALVMLA